MTKKKFTSKRLVVESLGRHGILVQDFWTDLKKATFDRQLLCITRCGDQIRDGSPRLAITKIQVLQISRYA
jgi:hypothetical protein